MSKMSVYDAYIAELFMYEDEHFHSTDLEVKVDMKVFDEIKGAFESK